MLIVLSNDDLKIELLAQGINEKAEVFWTTSIDSISDDLKADAIIDLLFENNAERINKLKQLQIETVFVNSVIHTLDQLPAGFIRFNGWKSFLKRSIVEAACNNEIMKTKASKIFSLFNKKIEWTADKPGFITARVIGMIINEAYFTFEEKVSTKAEIDIAMKLGTNYPYGPFEWVEKIGVKNIYELLDYLFISNKRYKPSALLQKEAAP